MRRAGGRDVLVELRRDGRGRFVCCAVCGALLDVTDSSSSSRLLEWEGTPGDTSPEGKDRCCAYAKSVVFVVFRRAMSEFPRVTNVMGGPRELSMPCPLWEAGGLLWGS